MSIDGGPMGNHTRFINHSCRENCAAKVLAANEVTIVTVRDVNRDEQLLLNYGDDYFQNLTCLCGEKDCLENKKKKTRRHKIKKHVGKNKFMKSKTKRKE